MVKEIQSVVEIVKGFDEEELATFQRIVECELKARVKARKGKVRPSTTLRHKKLFLEAWKAEGFVPETDDEYPEITKSQLCKYLIDLKGPNNVSSHFTNDGQTRLMPNLLAHGFVMDNGEIYRVTVKVAELKKEGLL